MIWKKIGKIFCADKNTDLMQTHAASPVAIHLLKDIYRIYFSARDKLNRSRTFFLDYDLGYKKIKLLHTNPIIPLGGIGTFNENGIIVTSVLNFEQKIYFYYVGFPRTATDFYRADTGLAISTDNGLTAENIFNGPIKSTSKVEPYFSSVQWITYDSDTFRMWYVSGEKWERKKNLHLKHYYNIKYCESNNGIDWSDGVIAVDFKNKHEYAIARPSIIKDEEKDYKMWYCYRGQKNINTYRIGYAESENGLRWVRKDRLMQQFDVSKNGWDSEMICYPFVFDHKGKRYMLYNGNGYGRTGFGLAVMEDD